MGRRKEVQARGFLLPSLLLTLNQAPFPPGTLRASPGKVSSCWLLAAWSPHDPWCEGMCPWTTSWKPAPCSPWAYTLASRFISSRLPLTNAGGCSAVQETQTDCSLMEKYIFTTCFLFSLGIYWSPRIIWATGG